MNRPGLFTQRPLKSSLTFQLEICFSQFPASSNSACLVAMFNSVIIDPRQTSTKEKQMDEEESGETIYHARLVAVLCFSLSSVISIWSQGQRPHLTESQRNQSFFLGNLFCSCYSALARNAFDRKLPLYRIRPKHHYWVHLLDYMHVSSVNPMATSNFLDEDLMKAMRGVAKACHPKTVKVSWSKRYILKRVISWGKSSNE